MKRNWLMQVALMAVMLALLMPSAAAGKGGNGKGGGGNGGGGDGGGDPACTRFVYSLYEIRDGSAGPDGLSRTCIEGGGDETLTGTTLGSRNRLEVSPDGLAVAVHQNGAAGLVLSTSDGGEIASFHTSGTDFPDDFYPTFSWRTDGSGDPLPTAEQFVAVRRGQQQIWAYHPVPGSTGTQLLDIEDQSGDSLWLTDLHWIAGRPADPSISWLVFRIWRNNVPAWHALTVETGTDTQGNATVASVGSPGALTSSTEINARPLHFSKLGTHAAWIFGNDSGLKRVALAYDASDAYAPPTFDGSTVEDLTWVVNAVGGFLQFGHVALSRDGGRLALTPDCEVWTLDLALGTSSLERISARSKRNKPCFHTPAWAE